MRGYHITLNSEPKTNWFINKHKRLGWVYHRSHRIGGCACLHWTHCSSARQISPSTMFGTWLLAVT